MKKITSILVALALFTTTSFASPTDTINEILSRNTKNNSTSNTLILNALGKKNENKQGVKLIKSKQEMSEQLEVKNNNNKDYIVGIDISKWNGNIDWEEVKKANVEFVIIRAGYGSDYVDPYFEKNMENAIKNDMIIGIYWFSYAHSNAMAKEEAKKCYQTIEKYKENIALPVFWDFEYDSVRYANQRGYTIDKNLATSMADTFCKEIKNRGFHAGIYCNIDYSKRYFTQEVLGKYHVWIAQWFSECTYKNHYIIWQCTDKFYINNQRFDMDYLYFNEYKEDLSNEK